MERDGFQEAQRASSLRAYTKILGLTLLVALFTLGILSTLPIPIVLQKFAFASTGKAKADLTQIESALEEYSRANAGEYPESLEALVTPDWNGHTYIKGTKVPKDPWGNEYLYDPPASEGSLPVVYTFGRDGRPGGKGDDADISSLSIRFED